MTFILQEPCITALSDNTVIVWLDSTLEKMQMSENGSRHAGTSTPDHAEHLNSRYAGQDWLVHAGKWALITDHGMQAKPSGGQITPAGNHRKSSHSLEQDPKNTI